MDVEKPVIQLCGPKTVLISSKFSGTNTIYSGTAILDRRIDRVVAMRVKYFNIPGLRFADLPNNITSFVILRSTALGSNLQEALFRTALSTDATVQQALIQSNAIGWFSRDCGLGAGGSVGYQSFMASGNPTQNNTNNLLRFTTEQSIEKFDWAIEFLNQTFTTAHTYSLDIAIEFFQECQCQSQMKNVYSM